MNNGERSEVVEVEGEKGMVVFYKRKDKTNYKVSCWSSPDDDVGFPCGIMIKVICEKAFAEYSSEIDAKQ